MSDEREPWYMVRGKTVIDIRATTCPRCNTGTEALCPHIDRVIQAVVERSRREHNRAVQADLDAVVADMRRNRAAIEASGPWDMAELAQGQKRALTWRQTLKIPHHTTGE
jgi:hypothetical protein